VQGRTKVTMMDQYRKSHTHFRLVPKPKPMNFDVLERPKRTRAKKNRFTEPTRIIWKKIDTYHQRKNVGQWF